jgi:hypothetical protein
MWWGETDPAKAGSVSLEYCGFFPERGAGTQPGVLTLGYRFFLRAGLKGSEDKEPYRM